MLSINVPVYNVEIRDLVLKLSEQAEKLKIKYEIRVYDDFSKPAIKEKNSEIAAVENVVYREMGKNMGRAAIRNRMGSDSVYNYLLFIDADSKIISEHYLAKYLRDAWGGTVACGGTAYSKKKPENPEKTLRWVYGKKREAISARQRNRDKGFIITANNFLIEKAVFTHIHFRETIKKYGHEDTMLGYDLSKAGYKIFHIDNPVEHTGLEKSGGFLTKTKMAVENLHFITENLVDDKKNFIRQITFLRKYYQLTSWLPEKVLRLLFRISEKLLKKNLLGRYPQLRIYDAYKLGCFAAIKNRRQS